MAVEDMYSVLGELMRCVMFDGDDVERLQKKCQEQLEMQEELAIVNSQAALAYAFAALNVSTERETYDDMVEYLQENGDEKEFVVGLLDHAIQIYEESGLKEADFDAYLIQELAMDFLDKKPIDDVVKYRNNQLAFRNFQTQYVVDVFNVCHHAQAVILGEKLLPQVINPLIERLEVFDLDKAYTCAGIYFVTAMATGAATFEPQTISNNRYKEFESLPYRVQLNLAFILSKAFIPVYEQSFNDPSVKQLKPLAKDLHVAIEKCITAKQPELLDIVDANLKYHFSEVSAKFLRDGVEHYGDPKNNQQQAHAIFNNSLVALMYFKYIVEAMLINDKPKASVLMANCVTAFIHVIGDEAGFNRMVSKLAKHSEEQGWTQYSDVSMDDMLDVLAEAAS